ncbi:MAG: Sec-independent protein translocase protein TatB [Gammaproteobacteria bacterium]|nr:Sec-independent protein translocase protein TatB [Gammaproteobacteria bacterium]
MFDIGPSELLVIFVVALLVIGPERLPSAVRTASLWIGRFRRSFHKIKSDVERELNADEIRRQLHNESILAEVEDAKNQAKEIASNVESAAVKELALDSGKAKDSEPEDKPEVTGTESTSDAGQGNDQAADTQSTEPPEPTVGSEIKQAVNYVNDISREVQASKEEIAEKIKNPGFASKDKSGNKS